MKLFSDSALYFSGNVIRRGVGFLMIPLYTRYLTPADYGVIELVELFVSVACITFGISAISESMVRIYHDYKEPQPRREIASTSVIGVALASLLVVGVAMPFAGWLSASLFGTANFTGLIRAALAAVVFSNVTEVALVYQRLRKRAVFFVAFSVILLTVNVGLNIYFIAVLREGAWGFVLSKLIYATAGALIMTVLVWREAGMKFRLEYARRIARFGWPLILTAVSFFVIHFADRFFVSHYAGLTETGIYALAYKFAFLVTYLVAEPFGSVWNVSLYEHANVAGWQREFARVGRYLIFGLLLGAVGIGLFSREVLTQAAGPAFAGAALTIPLLALGYALRGFGDFFHSLMFINKRVIAFSKITLGCAVLNLALNAALIPPFRSMGAAWATLITWAAYLLLCWWAAQSEHRLPSLTRPFAGLLAVSVLVLATSYYTGSLPLIWQTPIHISLLAAFVVLAWTGGYFSTGTTARLIRIGPFRLHVEAPWSLLPEPAKAALKHWAYRSGLLRFYHGVRNRRTLTVVAFHRVLPETDPRYRNADPIWTMPQGLFRQCLQFFAREYNPVTLDDVLRNRLEGVPLPRRALLVTFDDGWSDTEEHALALLRSAGMPATVFVIAGSVGVLARNDFRRLRLAVAANGGAAGVTGVNAARGEEEIVSEEQLLNLHRAGVTIGSHGVTHTPIPHSTDPAGELQESRKLLAGLLSLPEHLAPRSFSFPHGIHDSSSRQKAVEAGYELLFTSDPCLNLQKETAPARVGAQKQFVLGRLHLSAHAISGSDGTFSPELMACELFLRPVRRLAA